MTDDSNYSKVERTVVDFALRFEREINEIKEMLLRVLVSGNKKVIVEEINKKLDFISSGLGVFMDDLEQEGKLSSRDNAEIQLLQRHVLKIKIILETESIPNLIALLESLEKRTREFFEALEKKE